MTKRKSSRSERQYEAIADLARAKEDDQIFSASFFAKRNISIVDQQLRSFTLCHALSRLRIVRNSSQVAIVGAGFSGMTCAVALAMKHTCLIHVFEQDDVLLKRFQRASFRYIHPDLNTREIHDPDIYNLKDVPTKTTSFPFLNWSANYAPLVANELIRKFDHYRSKTTIALHLNSKVLNVTSEEPHNASTARRSRRRLLVHTDYEDEDLPCDLVILATGFGAERKFSESIDTSYWYSGNPDSYRPVLVPTTTGGEKVLIVGNGDSGVLELAHYLIKDFDQSDTFHYTPLKSPMTSRSFVDHVQGLFFRFIEDGGMRRSIRDFGGPVTWYESGSSRIRPRDKLFRKSGNRNRIMNALEKYLESHFSWDPAEMQKLEGEVEHFLDELAT
ncbi:FAD-dependent oxidoreductase [Bradyrhizobium sp. DASA03076]|uniref:FAD-dependent oxidoreductase n=1 Tax=Bradyrhizobium sp. BLXBL-03 TaxID=3395916 RepID=UPI003F6FCBB7